MYCLRAASRPEEARACAQKAVEEGEAALPSTVSIPRRDEPEAMEASWLPGCPIASAYVYAVAGARDRARAILEAYPLPWTCSTMHVRARTHAVLGEKDAALEWLEKAVAAGLRLPTPDPEFALLSGEPRYESLLRRTRGG